MDVRSGPQRELAYLLRMSTLPRLAPWRHCSGTRVPHRNRRRWAQHWTLTTPIGEMSMPRQPTTYQFDLFSKLNDEHQAPIDPRLVRRMNRTILVSVPKRVE